MTQTRTHITEEFKDLFQALRSGQFDNFYLTSCFLNGQPACAIAVVNTLANDGGAEPVFSVTPVFVSVTPDMVLTDHGGRPVAHCINCRESPCQPSQPDTHQPFPRAA